MNTNNKFDFVLIYDLYYSNFKVEQLNTEIAELREKMKVVFGERTKVYFYSITEPFNRDTDKYFPRN